MKTSDDKLTFDYEGNKLKVDVVYRKRKSISIKIIPKDTIQLICPHNIDKNILKDTINNNRKWIISKLNKFKNYNDDFINRKYTDSEIYYYLGKSYKLKIIEDKNIDNKRSYSYIDIKKDELEIRTNNCEKEYLREVLKKWYKLKSEDIISNRIDYLRKKSSLFASIDPDLVKVKQQKNIWGSCNSRKVIYINSKIAMLPLEAIDYIIVHEFCHILHMNHSKEFYSLVSKIIPNYEEIVQYLKNNNYKFNL